MDGQDGHMRWGLGKGHYKINQETGQDRTGKDKTGQDRAGQGRTVNTTGDRTWRGQDRERTGQDRTGLGQDRGQDSTGERKRTWERTGNMIEDKTMDIDIQMSN